MWDKINGNAQSFLHKNFVGTLNPIFVIYRTELKSKGLLYTNAELQYTYLWEAAPVFWQDQEISCSFFHSLFCYYVTRLKKRQKTETKYCRSYKNYCLPKWALLEEPFTSLKVDRPPNMFFFFCIKWQFCSLNFWIEP